MEPIGMLAKLSETTPKIRQFLVESSQRVADPELRERLAKIVSGLDENFSVVEQSLPGYLADLATRKANAEATINANLSKMRAVHDALVEYAQTVKARTQDKPTVDDDAEVEEPTPQVAAADDDDPNMGRLLREGLMRRYVWGAAPSREAAPPRSFEDWTDSVVQLEMPPVKRPTDEAPPPRPFDSWLDGTLHQGSAAEPGIPKKSDEVVQKLNQDFLKYLRKDDR